MEAHPEAWPPGVCDSERFEWCCGMVQSRAFHLVKDNWVTQTQTEGARVCLPSLFHTWAAVVRRGLGHARGWA